MGKNYHYRLNRFAKNLRDPDSRLQGCTFFLDLFLLPGDQPINRADSATKMNV
jgi:hypothetical protein